MAVESQGHMAASPPPSESGVIRVLVVDHAPATRRLMIETLSRESDLRVVGIARDGQEALYLAERLRPDIVTMDINMPGMNGAEATRSIMEKCPVPILIMSSALHARTDRLAFDAMQAGALSIMIKPKAGERFEQIRGELLAKIRMMSKVPVAHRRAAAPQRLRTPLQVPRAPAYKVRLIAIGSSAGGPGALNAIFSRLPNRFPVPLVVAQHMTPGFMSGMAVWLAAASPNPVKVAEHGELLKAGTIYVAADGKHTRVTQAGRIALDEGPEIDGARPSINHLFRSVADCYGPMALAVLLTGMGTDGVEGLARIRAMGGRTYAQDESTSVVFGMPQQAIQIGAVDRILRLEEIPQALIESLA